jgi:succinate dehydrogenase/fumarate reductase flavoprotein subunit
MENKKVTIDNYVLEYYSVSTLVIGSGAASLNAAVSLFSMGQEDIMIATSLWAGGTSNNAGSDKQTYYKLSLSGDEPDSVMMMAEDYYNGKCMHGDIALCEAQGSVRAFMNLVNLGVTFPQNTYGAWAGYKTDHDTRARATSAGPYTSKRMFEALADKVKKLKIKVLNKHQIIGLITDVGEDSGKVIGAIAIDLKEKDLKRAFVLINATNIILGTGGPGDLYKRSVYPLSQAGSAGFAFEAGATGQNLTESQFGIASVKFRWNLSGSYQQVIPRYISTDENGNDRKEFLNDFFPDITKLTKAIFLKGYQWPFDPRKIKDHGSSLIDLLVYREREAMNRRVFLDFTKNPSKTGNRKFSSDILDQEVYEYLKYSGSLGDTPFKRLESMNMAAIDLFRDHGIDLSKEPLEIAICAQHNNGGLKGNIWWESDLKHLFPVGEVNGSHGVYRPGGSALNSGQVGSFRAAQFISRRYNQKPCSTGLFLKKAKQQVKLKLKIASDCISSGKSKNNKKYFDEIRLRMSGFGGIIRDPAKVIKATEEAYDMLTNIKNGLGATSVKELADTFRLMDNCLTHYLYLEAIKIYLENGGRSRGSYLVTDPKGFLPDRRIESKWRFSLCGYNRKIEKCIIEIKYIDGVVKIDFAKVRKIPDQELWFERVWKDYIEDKFVKSWSDHTNYYL